MFDKNLGKYKGGWGEGANTAVPIHTPFSGQKR